MRATEPYLKRLLDLLHVSQSDLARQLDTSRQQVGKWANEGRKIRPDWAQKMEPILSVPWPMLVEEQIPPELQPSDGDAEKVHKQLLLIKEVWPLLSFDERGAIVTTIVSLTDPRRKSE